MSAASAYMSEKHTWGPHADEKDIRYKILTSN